MQTGGAASSSAGRVADSHGSGFEDGPKLDPANEERHEEPEDLHGSTMRDRHYVTKNDSNLQ